MKLDKNTLIVFAASTVIGLLGDVIISSVGESRGGKFKLHVPKGKALFQLLAVSTISGFVIDATVKGITESLKKDEEKKLEALVKKEVDRINAGELKDKTPEAIVWA